MHSFATYKTEKGIRHLILFSSLEAFGTFPMFDTTSGGQNPYLKSSVFHGIIEKVLITEGERAGRDMNKLHTNLLNRLLYCSTTMHSFQLHRPISVLKITESMYTIKGGLTKHNE